ncbi:BsuPI-related putative proteinase inhibitor [uncultured Shewanella sp.]|uniref:BsuPI-related putative proteinase inhibitor n=1 Tax=uncultured Shewanella sp. TaxID=173975 RepID=UPI002630F933|nr:BsuPI-related putative proteinase inhibitor [uncultured Shewanella sp.]
MNKIMLLSVGALVLTACSQGANEESLTEVSTVGKEQESVLVVPSNLELRDGQLTPTQTEQEKGVQDGLFSGELQVIADNGLSVTLLITNTQKYGVPIQYRSGKTADLHLLAPDGNRIWAWSDDMMFTQALRDVSIASGEVIRVGFEVPEKVLQRLKGRGYSLVASYAGRATESERAAMSDVSLSLDPYIR